MMKKAFLSIVGPFMLLLSMSSCTNDIVSDDSKMEGDREQTEQRQVSAPPQINAVYHEATDSWIKPTADPYTLANFQRAYMNLSMGKSVQSLSGSDIRRFPRMLLKATHYNVKIFP